MLMPSPKYLISQIIFWMSTSVLAMPVLAHQVKTSNEIGSTIHVEPADRARTNEQTVVWFALTRKGGQTVPLKDCQCQLQILQLPGKKLVMQPALQPINAEKYQSIPSATVLFKQAGAYVLELSGQPQAGISFQPFKLQFDLLVSPGTARAVPNIASSNPSTIDKPLASSPPKAVPAPIDWLLYLPGLLGAIAIAVIFVFTRLKK